MGQKKSRNLSVQKKIMQPLKKNSALFWDRKKSRNILGQKSHGTSQAKKIMQTPGTKKITQPLETKKKSCNLLGQKNSRNLSEQEIMQKDFFIYTLMLP